MDLDRFKNDKGTTDLVNKTLSDFNQIQDSDFMKYFHRFYVKTSYIL